MVSAMRGTGKASTRMVYGGTHSRRKSRTELFSAVDDGFIFHCRSDTAHTNNNLYCFYLRSFLGAVICFFFPLDFISHSAPRHTASVVDALATNFGARRV